nr:2-oxo-4-hydroxy-4-carboxy-5-ureidoimidazoline decarboxylase [Halobacillus campisalis]
MNIREINEMSDQDFANCLGKVFEDSPWVAVKAAQFRPYPSLDALHQRMVEIVSNAPEEEKLELIRIHPNLGDNIQMSEDSVREQQGAGLKNLSEEEFASFQSLNERYTKKFGFPFIFAVKGKYKDDIHEALKERVDNSETEEFDKALSEIYKIARFRLQDKLMA